MAVYVVVAAAAAEIPGVASEAGAKSSNKKPYAELPLASRKWIVYTSRVSDGSGTQI